MKRENLGYLLAGVSFFLMISMTINSASYDNRFRSNNGIILNVPAKPAATAYANGTDEMYKYSISSRVTKVTTLKRVTKYNKWWMAEELMKCITTS